MIWPAQAMIRIVRRHPSVAVFIAAYFAAFIALSTARGDHRVFPYLVVLTVLGVGVAYADGADGRFPRPLVWAFAVNGLLHMIGGLAPSPDPGAPVFYETWLIPGVVKYDQFVHLVGTAIATTACWMRLSSWADTTRAPRLSMVTAAATMGLGLGAGNEVFEFISAQRLANLHIGGFQNTGWDLVFNLAGAVIVAVWLAVGPPAVCAVRPAERASLHTLGDGGVAAVRRP